MKESEKIKPEKQNENKSLGKVFVNKENIIIILTLQIHVNYLKLKKKLC